MQSTTRHRWPASTPAQVPQQIWEQPDRPWNNNWAVRIGVLGGVVVAVIYVADVKTPVIM